LILAPPSQLFGTFCRSGPSLVSQNPKAEVGLVQRLAVLHEGDGPISAREVDALKELLLQWSQLPQGGEPRQEKKISDLFGSFRKGNEIQKG
jgi:hypothetical protein